jgi:hypothetical protein
MVKTDSYAASIDLSKPKPKAAALLDRAASPDEALPNGLPSDALFDDELFDEFFSAEYPTGYPPRVSSGFNFVRRGDAGDGGNPQRQARGRCGPRETRPRDLHVNG